MTIGPLGIELGSTSPFGRYNSSTPGRVFQQNFGSVTFGTWGSFEATGRLALQNCGGLKAWCKEGDSDYSGGGKPPASFRHEKLQSCSNLQQNLLEPSVWVSIEPEFELGFYTDVWQSLS